MGAVYFLSLFSSSGVRVERELPGPGAGARLTDEVGPRTGLRREELWAWRARMRGGCCQQWARRLTRGLVDLGLPVSVGDCPARSA